MGYVAAGVCALPAGHPHRLGDALVARVGCAFVYPAACIRWRHAAPCSKAERGRWGDAKTQRTGVEARLTKLQKELAKERSRVFNPAPHTWCVPYLSLSTVCASRRSAPLRRRATSSGATAAGCGQRSSQRWLTPLCCRLQPCGAVWTLTTGQTWGHRRREQTQLNLSKVCVECNEVFTEEFQRCAVCGLAAHTECTQVRLCRHRVFPTGDVGYRGISGAVGLGYRFTVQADPATRPK